VLILLTIICWYLSLKEKKTLFICRTFERARHYADYKIGLQLKEFFDDNPDTDECRFEAEL